ncbi:MAG: aldo/keto reductase [Thermoguttaceae bacterium]|jgi:aryl-alcohol dehydrogenase-like predicted oxidoreductase
MKYRRLGCTDLEVSTVCMGCWSISTKDFFWDGQAREDSIRAIHGSLEAGVNFFDTAPAYGNGESEEILGEALQGRRAKCVVATKVPPGDLEPAKLRASCEASLRALQTDYVDLYQVHWPNPGVPWEATWGALAQLQAEGKIRAAGVSNFGVSYLEQLPHRGRAETNQLPYSLLWRAVEYEILPWCRAHATGLLCYSPLAQGLLTGKFRAPQEVPDKRARTRLFSARRPLTRHGEPGCQDEAFAAIDALRAIAAEVGQALSRVAVAWLLHQPGVAAVVAGARDARQAADNAQAAEVELDDAVTRRLAEATETVKQIIGANADPWEHVSRMERP